MYLTDFIQKKGAGLLDAMAAHFFLQHNLNTRYTHTTNITKLPRERTCMYVKDEMNSGQVRDGDITLLSKRGGNEPVWRLDNACSLVTRLLHSLNFIHCFKMTCTPTYYNRVLALYPSRRGRRRKLLLS